MKYLLIMVSSLQKLKQMGGVNKVLELIGTTTLKNSLQCANEGGIVCMTGVVGN